jgi:hypothetical protein
MAAKEKLYFKEIKRERILGTKKEVAGILKFIEKHRDNSGRQGARPQHRWRPQMKATHHSFMYKWKRYSS